MICERCKKPIRKKYRHVRFKYQGFTFFIRRFTDFCRECFIRAYIIEYIKGAIESIVPEMDWDLYARYHVFSAIDKSRCTSELIRDMNRILKAGKILTANKKWAVKFSDEEVIINPHPQKRGPFALLCWQELPYYYFVRKRDAKKYALAFKKAWKEICYHDKSFELINLGGKG